MKSKVLAIMAILLVTSLVCFGTVSCSQDAAEEENDSGNITQPLTEDEYQIEIAAPYFLGGNAHLWRDEFRSAGRDNLVWDVPKIRAHAASVGRGCARARYVRYR